MPVRITASIDNIDERTFDALWRDYNQHGPGSRYEVVLDRIDGDHIETELHFRLAGLTATGDIRPVVRLEGGEQHLPPGNYTGHVTSMRYNIASNVPEVTMYISDDTAPSRDDIDVRLVGPAQLPPGMYTGRVTSTDYRIGSDRPEVTIRITQGLEDEIDRLREDVARAAELERQRYPLRAVHFGGLDGKGPVFEAPVPQDQGLHRVQHLNVAALAEVLAQIIALEKISPRVLGIPGEGGLLAARIEAYLTGGEHMPHKHGKPGEPDQKDSKGGGKHEKPGSDKSGKGGK